MEEVERAIKDERPFEFSIMKGGEPWRVTVLATKFELHKTGRKANIDGQMTVGRFMGEPFHATMRNVDGKREGVGILIFTNEPAPQPQA